MFAFNFIVIVIVSAVATIFSRDFMLDYYDYENQVFTSGLYIFENAGSLAELEWRVFFSFYLILN